jgi:hypothetical protein
VLLSRARNGLVMIGNTDTFKGSRSGKEVWGKFFEIMNENGHLYDGLPIKCESHPDRTAIIRTAAEFNEVSPNGGCKEPW